MELRLAFLAEKMEQVGRHLAEQQGKSVAQLAREYRRYAQREGKRYKATDPPDKLAELFISLDIIGPDSTPRERKQYREAYRHIANGTQPPLPTRFREENTPIFCLVFAKLMEISRDGTLLDDEDVN